MNNLLDLTLETTTETTYKNIPQEIRDNNYRNLANVLFAENVLYYFHPLWEADPNQHLFQMWLDGKGRQPASWGQLSEALKKIRMHDLCKIVTRNSESLELTMNNLLNFPCKKTVTKSANIPREVGVKYFDFGTHLLQDPTGAHLRDLEHELFRNGKEINKRILTEWLEGKGRPVTWATLVKVLYYIDMGELAKQIEVRYVKDKSSVTM